MPTLYASKAVAFSRYRDVSSAPLSWNPWVSVVALPNSNSQDDVIDPRVHVLHRHPVLALTAELNENQDGADPKSSPNSLPPLEVVPDAARYNGGREVQPASQHGNASSLWKVLVAVSGSGCRYFDHPAPMREVGTQIVRAGAAAGDRS
jgi:hypothetical protein